MRFKTARELQTELVIISETDESRTNRIFALALATLINENVPDDRSILRVKSKAFACISSVQKDGEK